MKRYKVTIPVTSEVTAMVKAKNPTEAYEKAIIKAIDETPLVSWMVDEDAIEEDCVSEREESDTYKEKENSTIRGMKELMQLTGFKNVYTQNHNGSVGYVYIDPETLSNMTISENEYQDVEEIWNLLGVDEEDIKERIIEKHNIENPEKPLTEEEVASQIDDEGKTYMKVMAQLIKDSEVRK